MGVRKPTVASPKCHRCHQKPPGAYKPNSRQQHYNPPILDSTQFPQLGRTTNNPHPTLSYPIHIPPIPHDAMIQRQSSTKNLRGGFMKTARTPTRACRIHSTHASKSPAADRSRMALSKSDSSSEALDLERAARLPDRLVELRLTTLPGRARNARSSYAERRRNHFSIFSTCTSGIFPSECIAKLANTISMSPFAKLSILLTKFPRFRSLEVGLKLTYPVPLSYHSGTSRRKPGVNSALP